MYVHRSEQDVPSIAAAVAAGPLSGLADVVAEYERAVAKRFGAAEAVAVSSGTAALHAALHIAKVRTGRTEVLVPAMAPLPTLLPVLAAGLEPHFVDVAPDRLEFDGADLTRALERRPAAVLTVSLWGYPFDVRPHVDMIRSGGGTYLVEDAAQAHGTTLGGEQVGSAADLSCFSTHDRKTLATGEGGFVLGRDPELLDEVRRFCRLGSLSGTHAGLNYKLNGLAAALGLARIGDVDTIISRRNENARVVLGSLRPEWGLRELGHPSDAAPNHYSLVLSTSDGGHEFAQRLAALGVETDPIRWRYRVSYRHDLFTRWARPCPGAEHLVDNAHQLEVDPNLGADELAATVAALGAASNR